MNNEACESHSAPLFDCPRQPGGLRLTPAACARLWTRGRTATPEEAVYACCGCPIGAQHARDPDPAPLVPPPICPRCGRSCGPGRRLIAARGICISCYNREREIERGRDRRGHTPREWVPVHSLQGGGQVVARPSVGLTELSLWALRQTPTAAVARCAVEADIAVHLARVRPLSRETPAEIAVFLALHEPLSRRVPHGGPLQLGLWPGIDYRRG